MTTEERLGDARRRVRSLQLVLTTVRTEVPGWLLNDALLEALDLLACQIALDLAIVDRDGQMRRLDE